MVAKRIPHLKVKLWGTAAYILCLGVARWLQKPCLFRVLFHRPCAGCGMTRAWIAAAHMEFGKAFAFHPLFWTVPLLYGYMLTEGALFNRKWADRIVLTLLLATYGLLGLGRLFIPTW